jgi:hypothetical protein
MSHFPDSESAPVAYSQLGGARIEKGAFLALNATWPLVRLTVDSTKLEMSFLKHWIFPKTTIRRLSKHCGLFSVGLRIEHDIKDYNPFIVFWTFRFPQLEEKLRQFGYPVL